MNQFIKSQCENMIQSVKVFKSSCEFAAKKDDGNISKDEAKNLERIKKTADRFIKGLEKILN